MPIRKALFNKLDKPAEYVFKNKKLKSYKEYATRYRISTINNDVKPDNPKYHRTVDSILNDIYEYEKINRPNDALYPFFRS